MTTDALNQLLKENPALYKALVAQVACEKSLYKFIQIMWEFVEPANPFVGGWAVEAMCDHLEAVTRGDIKRLLINVPPGCMKSLLTDVFWPAWEWGPCNLPHMRYLATSYSSSLTERDNIRFRQIITSDLYKAMWGDRFGFSRDSFNITKVGNNKTGFKLATSTDGLGTGERANRIICDDLHNVRDGESEAVRKSTLQYFQEVLPTRTTSPLDSAFIVIMQRVHEEDVSGLILKNDLGYDHLCLPMKFESGFPKIPTSIGFTDPRTEEGELLFPGRFPAEVVERDAKVMGPYATAGQMQQRPAPRGGGIIKTDYWKYWPEDDAGSIPEEFDGNLDPLKKMQFPVMDYVIATTDTAYTSKTSSDFNALAVLGVWRRRGLPKIMLMHCWQKRLDFRGETLPRLPDETEREYKRRRKNGWGMLEWTAYECQRWGVDKLLIEGKATGLTLAQEIRKVYNNDKWAVQVINPKGDKETRMYSVQHIWAEGMVYCPDRAWATEAIEECAKFPKGAHDDLPDAIVQGIRWLRDTGWALRRDEVKAEDRDNNKFRTKPGPLYDV